jgi:acyl-CoA synthetase (AMP-forming)/AMP-acid ligase II
MRRERTAYMFMVPTILNAINRIPGIESVRVPDLKCMLVSAASISDETALKAYEIFRDAMYQGYGQTEVLPVAMMARDNGSPRMCPARSRCAPAA